MSPHVVYTISQLSRLRFCTLPQLQVFKVGVLQPLVFGINRAGGQFQWAHGLPHLVQDHVCLTSNLSLRYMRTKGHGDMCLVW